MLLIYFRGSCHYEWLYCLSFDGGRVTVCPKKHTVLFSTKSNEDVRGTWVWLSTDQMLLTSSENSGISLHQLHSCMLKNLYLQWKRGLWNLIRGSNIISACVWTLASSICKQPNFRLKNWSKCMASFSSMPSEVTETQFCSLLCLSVPFCSAFPVNCFVWCNPCQWNHVAGSQN